MDAEGVVASWHVGIGKAASKRVGCEGTVKDVHRALQKKTRDADCKDAEPVLPRDWAEGTEVFRNEEKAMRKYDIKLLLNILIAHYSTKLSKFPGIPNGPLNNLWNCPSANLFTVRMIDGYTPPDRSCLPVQDW